MLYHVTWAEAAIYDIAELPKQLSDRITKKVELYLAQEPRQLGEALVGGFSGYWRYRIGDYRVIYSIHDEHITIHVVRVGHRKSIYDR